MWETLKEDVMGYFSEFHNAGRIVKGANASFLALIPKVDNPQKIEEYRPISLINSMYKMLSKVLANRLKTMMDDLIVLDEARSKKIKGFCFKVDFEKAYDRVSWAFLDYMLKRMGFNHVWCQWMKECMHSASISVLVNGGTTKQFSPSRGLRQGDPLSPFLFLLIAEGLNGLISSAKEKGLLKGLKIGNGGIEITHLQFADDMIMFGRAEDSNVWVVKCIMRVFELISGLKINFDKSLLYGLNVEEEWVEKTAWSLNCRRGPLPFKYLGIPIGGNHRRLTFWRPLIQGFKNRLASWKGKLLSLGGRITLVNSVLSSLLVFFMSFFFVPKGVINELEKIRRDFLWGKKEGGGGISWVKWDSVCKPKEEGGLGVRDLRTFNIVLLGKWWGRMAGKERGLWKRVLNTKYGVEEGRWLEWVRGEIKGGSYWWRDLCRINFILPNRENWLGEGFNIHLGDGGGIRFWKDVWLGEVNLATRFPKLFLLSTGKDNKIQQMGEWYNNMWQWKLTWRRSMRGWEEEKLQELFNLMLNITLDRGQQDAWCRRHTKEGIYTAKLGYLLLRDQQGGDDTKLFRKVWNKYIPNKPCVASAGRHWKIPTTCSWNAPL
ncbi:hypothetical protein SLEP1_g36575 [Rubroshorea leprosula]|uniref:Reverse transcriptase domain-containing protein n=1 Tax=Rubroshorea leprosula TaxID=152421 RepID=A0AAV5KRX1_9ROSI|nr:hypothetical protein SLEP1_g36575 [Rubroshorea leprosula]